MGYFGMVVCAAVLLKHFLVNRGAKAAALEEKQ